MKRGAEVQITKDGVGYPGEVSESMNPQDGTPQRATAAQLAQRKMKQAKSRLGAGRPGGGFGAKPLGQAPGSSFPPTNGSNAFGGLPQSTNASFPSFGAGTSPSSSFSFGQPPAADSFNFNAGSTGNNPFANMGSQNNNSAPSAGGFSFNFGQPAQPQTNGATGSNPFSQTQPAPASSGPPTFSFGGSLTQTPAFGQTQPSSTPSFSFGQPAKTDSSTPTTSAPSSNIFGGTPFSFGGGSIANPFAAPKPAESAEAAPAQSNDEDMTISPEASPYKGANGAASNPFNMLNQPTFGASKPTETSPTKTAPPATGFGNNLFSNAGGFKFGAPAAQPAKSPTEPEKPAQPEEPKEAEPAKANPFASLSKHPTPGPFSFGAPAASPAKQSTTPPGSPAKKDAAPTAAPTANLFSGAPSFSFGAPKASEPAKTLDFSQAASASKPFTSGTPFSFGNNTAKPSDSQATAPKAPLFSPAPAVQPPQSAPAIQAPAAGAQQQLQPSDAKLSAPGHEKLMKLNLAMLQHLQKAKPADDWSPVMVYYLTQAEKIFSAETGKGTPLGDYVNQAQGQAANKPQLNGAAQTQPQSTSPASGSFPASKRKADKPAHSELDNYEPGKRQKANEVSYPLLPPFEADKNKSSTANLFSSILEKPAPTQAAPAAKASGFSFSTPSTPASTENQTVSAQAVGNTPASTNNASNIFGFKPTAPQPAAAAAPAAPASPFKFTPATSQPASAAPSAPSGGFVFKPTPSTSTPSTTAGMPKFSGGNFMSQFVETAKKDVEEEKRKNKQKAMDADYDSDEETKEQWSARYDAEQKKKEQEAAASATAKKAKFVPGKGFVFDDDASSEQSTETSQDKASDKPETSSSLFVPNGGSFLSRSASPSNAGSVFASPALGPQPMSNDNIFGHLSNVGSPADDKDDDEPDAPADDYDGPLRDPPKKRPMSSRQDDDDEGQDLGAALRASKRRASDDQTGSGVATPGGSLFDRIKTGTDGRPVKDATANGDETPKASLFNFSGSQGSAFGSSIFGSAKAGDATWKEGTPIKFGTGEPPKFNFTPASPAKSVEATPKASDNPIEAPTPKPANPFGNLFSSTGGFKSSTPSLFSNSVTSTPGASTPTYKFGGPPTSAGSLFAPQSGFSTRSASPAPSTDAGDSAAESTTANDEDAQADPQSDLTALSEQEKATEDVLFEIKAKAMKQVKNSETGKHEWATGGTGPFRLLKNKESGVVRILMRAAPSGKVVINSRLLAKVTYKKAQAKAAQVVATGDDGKLVNWVVRVGKDEDIDRLVKMCEENKPI